MLPRTTAIAPQREAGRNYLCWWRNGGEQRLRCAGFGGRDFVLDGNVGRPGGAILRREVGGDGGGEAGTQGKDGGGGEVVGDASAEKAQALDGEGEWRRGGGEAGRMNVQSGFVVGGDGVKKGDMGADVEARGWEVAGAQGVEEGVRLGVQR